MKWISKKQFGLLLMSLVLLSGILYALLYHSKSSPQFSGEDTHEFGLHVKEIKALDQFVSAYFMKNGLVQTNLKATVQRDQASGEDLLSESVGLMLLYYVKTNQEKAFLDHLQLANGLLQKNNGLYQWRYRYGQATSVSASVDDLRIAKALILGYEKWGNEDLKKQAGALSESLIKNCTIKNELLSYDDSSAGEAPLFYYDFRAMEQLAYFDSKWLEIEARGLSLLEKNKIEGEPFYWHDEKTNAPYKMIENALIALYLSEIDKLSDSDLKWFERKLDEGSVYASYTSDNQPASNIESPSIYGIIAQIAKNENDQSLYIQSTNKLKSMQHLSQDEYYGGFVDLESRDAYSFDQLMGLLGY